MNSKQMTGLLIGAAVVAGIVYAVRSAQADVTPPTRVTRSDKGGLVSSPINETRAAFLTNPFRVAIDFFARNITAARTYIAGAIPQSGDKLTRQNNVLSAVAAATAPLRADYRAKIEPALSKAKPVEISRAGNSFQFN